MTTNGKIVTMAFAAFMALGPAPVAAEDAPSPLVGQWTLNLEESIAPQGKSLRPFTLLIRESGEVLDFTQFTRDAAGNETTFTHRTATDGVTRELPGMPGAKAAFTRLPSGVIDAKLKFPDGALQNKICVLQPSLVRQVCLATITTPSGHTVFFKHVLDKIPADDALSPPREAARP